MTRTCGCGRPTSGAWLCDGDDVHSGCRTTLAYAIANIAAYYDDLDTVACKRARYSDQPATKSSTGHTEPLPLDMRFANHAVTTTTDGAVMVFDQLTKRGEPLAPGRATLAPGVQLRWDAEATVSAWCRVVMEDAPEVHGPVCGTPCLHPTCAETRRRRWPGDTVRSMCLYLDRMHRWVEASEWAPVMLDEFLDLERRLCRMVNRPPDRWYAGICSAADQHGMCSAELYATYGQGQMTCPACDTQHDVGARREYLLAEARDHLVTATEAAGALIAWTDYDRSERSLMARISKWQERGRVQARGSAEVLGRERPLYRLGDLQALLVEDAQREQARRVSA
jgi:hypothetical protein